nr:unnamed protein product [Spirometra erinaceieuropaei]
MRIRLQPGRRPQGKRPPGKLNIALLSLPAHHLHFTNELAQRLANLPVASDASVEETASVENRWCQLREAAQSTGLAVLGRAHRQHQDWFDKNDVATSNLFAVEDRLQKAYANRSTDENKAAFYRCHRLLQQRSREIQEDWTVRKAEEIQEYADRNEWRNLFVAIKGVYVPPTKGTTPQLNADSSTPLTEIQTLQRWVENFRGAINCPFTISDAAIARLPQVETNSELDLPPSHHETIGTKQHPSRGKAPVSEASPTEIYKHGSHQLMDLRAAVFQKMWLQGHVPQYFKTPQPSISISGMLIVSSMTSTEASPSSTSPGNPSLVFFPTVFNNHLEQGHLQERQCGSHRHRGTTDMIFTVRQLHGKCWEMLTHLYSTFMDLTKAFDALNREELWRNMQKYGCPERSTQMVSQLHDGMAARVTDNGAVSKAFAETNGVKQSCVLTPTLFSLMFSAMLMDAQP